MQLFFKTKVVLTGILKMVLKVTQEMRRLKDITSENKMENYYFEGLNAALVLVVLFSNIPC